MFHKDWSSSFGEDSNKKLRQIVNIRVKFCSIQIQLRQNQKLNHCHSH